MASLDYFSPLSSSATSESGIPARYTQPKKTNFQGGPSDYLTTLNIKTPVNYNLGKSSSTVSQYPAATGVGIIGLSPSHQKYRSTIQPAGSESYKSYEPGYSTVAPVNLKYERFTASPKSENLAAQASEEISSDLKKNCRRLERPDSESLNCFVCESAENKSKYTQCSYASGDEPASSNVYTVPVRAPFSRSKRYSNKNDPYEIIKRRSQQQFESPSIPEDYSAGFLYDGEAYDESKPELSYSERESEELKKNPENCKKIAKDGMTCTICKNPNGGNFEQCSYTSEPKEKKYAYVTEKKYDSDEPEESKVVPQTKTIQLTQESRQKPVQLKTDKKIARDYEPIEKHESRIEQTKYPKKRNDDSRSITSEDSSEKADDNSYDIPRHFAESIQSEQKHKEDDGGEEAESNEEEQLSDFDAYHAKLFPELNSKKESEDERDEGEEYHIPAASKQNVEEVLAQFSKKDRTSCKKAEKNGMTCFLCVDQNNIQHEECMYVQESRPQSSHVAFHQAKNLKKSPKESTSEETKALPVINQAADSEGFETTVPRKVKRSTKQKRNNKKANRPEEEEKEPTVETPEEFEVGNEEGAFSHETKQVYSKLHGANLPKYMVEKSEFEKEFDESSSGY